MIINYLSFVIFLFFCVTINSYQGFPSNMLKISSFFPSTLSVLKNSNIPSKHSEFNNRLKKKQMEFKQNRSPKRMNNGASSQKNYSYNRYQESWWMKASEENNPRVLPKYSPWWLTANFNVTSSWTIEFLVREAKRRGIAIEDEEELLNYKESEKKGSKSLDEIKENLIQHINTLGQLYKLDDSSFTKPSVLHLEDDVYHYPCFPDVYNNSELMKEHSKKNDNV